MAIHTNSAKLSAEVIEEFIEHARMGLAYRKPTGGCFGFSSTLLMFCVIDALSNRLGFPEHSFAALNHDIFGLRLHDDQIESLKVWYRHSLAHNGMIAPGTILTPEPDGVPIEIVWGEPVVIRVIPLFHLVERAWRKFDKASLKPRNSKKPKAPIDFSGLIAFSLASSGSPVVYKPVKM